MKPVKVTVPISTAANLGKFKEVVGSTLDELGCPACCSGYDITFELARNFAVSDDLKISSKNSDIVTGITPATTSVELGDGVAGDIQKVHKAIEMVADELGCPTCCSGIDLKLSQETVLLKRD